MNILIVSYLFSPTNNPQSILSTRLANKFSELGHDVTVIAANYNSRYPSTHGLDESISVRDDVDVIYLEDAIDSSFKNRTLQKIFYLNESESWLNKIKKIDISDRKFDVIYGITAPLSSGLAAKIISDKLGVPYFIHLSDPFFYVSGLRFLSPFKHYSLINTEINLLKGAAGVTFVNQETLTASIPDAHFLISNSKIFGHFYDDSTYENIQYKTSVYTFTYVGSLYSKRDPYDLIKAFDLFVSKNPLKANQFCVRLVGKIEQKIIDHLSKVDRPWLQIVGPVNYADSIREMHSADALLLIDMNVTNNLFTPSKIVDYIATYKPILCLTPSHSPSDAICKGIRAFAFSHKDVNAISDSIQILVGGDYCVDDSLYKIKLADFDPRYISSSIVQFFRERT